MENFIKGKFTKVIYQNVESNYAVTLFKVSETNDINVEQEVGKTINVTGVIPEIKIGAFYVLYGNYVFHPKYSWQFTFTSFEILKPTSLEEMESFLASSFIEGCGKVMAKKIVTKFGLDSINKIKEDYNNLLLIDKMTPAKALKIFASVQNYDRNEDAIKFFNKLGFSYDDASKIINKHYYDLDAIMDGELYLLKDIFEFKKIDDIYKENFDDQSNLRIKECLLNSLMQISFNEGSTYYYYDDMYKALSALFNLNVGEEKFSLVLEELINESLIIKIGKKYYLDKYYFEETGIAYKVSLLSKEKVSKITKIDEKIKAVEDDLNIKYNDEQKKAIKNGLNEKISIISGGPGTGKTTIIKAITKIYIDDKKLSKADIMAEVALLAPTGRASKRLSIATNLPAYTIHRFLKWHKEEDTFEYNEDNKLVQKLYIIDESSMIDVSLMYALFAALPSYARVILVGDIYQLPSVGPGLVLQDLINSDYFTFTPLNVIYRQSENSYIPYLAKDIKNQNILDDDYLYKRDDYAFIVSSEDEVLGKVINAVRKAKEKGIDENNMQILAPMYKGINGIDNINKNLQNIYNPPSDKKKEIIYGDKLYRENDKVLQLVNDSDNNVFNGDIGRILSIYKDPKNKEIIQIDFDGNIVDIERKDLKNITLAYAISIHKSQGSEFEHVIIPICPKYFIMLYNKLIYTGVSRAKKSLTIIGDPRSFINSVNNNYAMNRNTSLKEFLDIKFQE